MTAYERDAASIRRRFIASLNLNLVTHDEQEISRLSPFELSSLVSRSFLFHFSPRIIVIIVIVIQPWADLIHVLRGGTKILCALSMCCLSLPFWVYLAGHR